jgi:transmembrane sensor
MKEMRTEAESDAPRQAASWHARLGAPDCTGFDRARFEEWRTASHNNARASDAAGRVDTLLDELGATDAELLAMADEAFEASRGRPFTQRVARWALPIAASAVIGSLLLIFSPSRGMLEHGTDAHFVAADNRRNFTLDDGSVVHLDVRSELSVRMSGERRDINLVRGRALFDVAHDSARPFVVSAGSARVTALGTHFQVKHESDGVIVTLTEGSVAVADTAMPSWRETLRPGEEVSVSAGPGAHLKHATDVLVATSWSSGRHVFRATPLAVAVQEINHYAARKVRLGDPQLASLVVGGNFVAGDSESVVAAFAAALPVRVVDGGGELILFQRYEAESH